jgi:hypothetical protein
MHLGRGTLVARRTGATRAAVVVGGEKDNNQTKPETDHGADLLSSLSK